MKSDVLTSGRPGSVGGTWDTAPAEARRQSRQPAPAPDARRQQRPARRPRPDRPASPVLPASPVRPVSPVRPAGPGRPGRSIRTGGPARQELQTPDPSGEHGAGRAGSSDRGTLAGARQAGQLGRASFVVLVLGLLGGGLVCLLVVNTTLAANSIRISNLQQANSTATQRVQQLEQQVAAASSAAVIEQEARRLGMRADPLLTFVDVPAGKIAASSGSAPVQSPAPGATTRAGSGTRPGGGNGTGAGHNARHLRKAGTAR